MMKNKKAVSQHVEMIISFMLFLVFVMFLLMFVRPYERNALPESVLAGLEDSFIAKTSVDLTSVFISSECGNVDVGLIPGTLGSSFVVKNAVGGNFYLLFADGLSGGVSGTCDNFTIGSIEESRIVSYAELQDMKVRYEGGYNDLRTDLGVPKTIEFAIITNDASSMERFVPDSVSVIASTVSRPVLMSDGSIINKEFVLKIW